MNAKQYISNLFRWKRGRQETGYEKMLLAANPCLVPFDLYLLRYFEGSEIPVHVDPVKGQRHYRLNVELWKADSGGEFRCETVIFEAPRLKVFRPDIAAHSVSKVTKGSRYVLSLGWVRS